MSDSDESEFEEDRPTGSCLAKGVYDEAPISDDTATFYDYDQRQGPWFQCMPNGVMNPRVAQRGIGGPECAPSTLPLLLAQAAENHADESALMVERPLPPLENGQAPPALAADEWTQWTYEEWYEEVKSAARGFIQLGFAQFDTVNIWGFNSPEWHTSCLAANLAGGKVGGLYPTDTPDTAAYKVVHSGGSIIVLEDRSKLDKLVPALKEKLAEFGMNGGKIKAFVAYGFEPKPNESAAIMGRNIPVISYQTLITMSPASSETASIMDERVRSTSPGHCAALIYTSGTTGEPKAVMISHDNLIFESSAVLKVLAAQEVGTQESQERILSYLPLSHVAGMMVDIVSPIILAAKSSSWFTIYFARPYDLKVGAIKDRLLVAKPTLFLGVPLVWEKIADKIRAIGAENTGLKKRIADWAKGRALEHSKNCLLGGSGAYPCGYGLANVLLKKIKAGLGLDECKYGFTGAAPIRIDTLEYFGSLGLMINEVYGMSECAGACTISTDEAHSWGSCGWQMPGVEVRAFLVDPQNINSKTECPLAPDLDDQSEEYQGELCFRGRNIMMGYMANPDMGQAHVEEIRRKTAETIDASGWLHSGDKGMITEGGLVKITGRYKELIIGEGGENIAPVPIEDFVKKSCDGVNEVMMVGDKRKYNVALVTLKAVGANGETPGTDALDAGAKRVNPSVTTISAALDDKTWIDVVEKAINAANKNGKVCPNNAFKIQKFTILPFNFSEEKSELTPTKKLKRKAVETSYKDMIERMYKTDGTYIRWVS